MTTAKEIIEYMESLRNEEQRRLLMGFFKTGPGEYGYGDEFLGLKVPQTREVVKAVAKDFQLDEVPELLMSKWHEVRLCGLLILVDRFEKLATKRLEHNAEAIKKRDEIVTMYLKYAERANNWDLVDLSVHKILGHWLVLPTSLGGVDVDIHKQYKLKVLDELASSDPQPPNLGGSGLWKQRMSIVCSWKTSQMGDPSWCLRYAEIHLHHPHDLMHKAVGWMLREMGKRCSMDLLRDFLRQHAYEMPRTMLRYAIEKMSESERKDWMSIPADRFESDYVVKTNPYAGIPVPAFLEMIFKGDDEAMNYLLHQRLNHQLRERYNAYHHLLYDDFEDAVEDFFLYLRESGRYPYQALRRIKNKEAFETWMLNTFRNYLSNRAQAENGTSFVLYSDHGFHGFHGLANANTIATDEAQEPLSEEQKLMIASQLIAYALQVFYPRGRFIFLRSLLTMLNRQKALPNAEVAKALGMTDISYRVTLHHMKCNLAKFRQRLLQGETLRLDEEHQQIAQRIYDDFEHLYPTLLACYTHTIDSLKCAEAIKQLRQQHYEATGIMAHEPEPSNSIVVTATGFWNKLNKMLIC
jgi:3-methyladenine DNA glycosylase AlkD